MQFASIFDTLEGDTMIQICHLHVFLAHLAPYTTHQQNQYMRVMYCIRDECAFKF